MDQEKKPGFYLKWPWNAVVYIILAVVLRLWAVPFIVLIMLKNRSAMQNDPNASFCLQKTQARMGGLVIALITLACAAGAGFLFWGLPKYDSPTDTWTLENWAFYIFAGAACVVLAAVTVFIAYRALRDSLFPEKSTLAQSIRSQLPHPDEAPPVKELFALVDHDIRESGVWFGKLVVGKEWVLGDTTAMSIPRIRAILPLDKLVYQHIGNARHKRVLELHLLDDRQNTLCGSFALSGAKELEAAAECIRMRAPWAKVCHKEEDFLHLIGLSEEAWYTWEKEIRQTAAQHLDRQAQRTQQTAGNSDRFVFTGLDGQRTSRVNVSQVFQALETLSRQGEGAHLSLELLEPIHAGVMGRLSRLDSGISNLGFTIIAVLQQPDGRYLGYAKGCTPAEAQALYQRLMERGEVPDDLPQWQMLQQVTDHQPQQVRAELTLWEASGAKRSFTTFSRRDVELAGKGLGSGKYRAVLLMAGAHYIQLVAGDAPNHPVTVRLSDPRPDDLYLFERTCSHQEAAALLLTFADGGPLPDFRGWKDITRQVKQQ